MRISDWSSTCALPICTREEDKPVVRCQRFELVACRLEGDAGAFRKLFGDRDVEARGRVQPRSDRGAALRQLADRSEEHTSEFQSLMRISYAFSCLKTHI